MRKLLFIIAILFLPIAASADTFSSTNFQVLDPVISAGGEFSTSSGFQLHHSVGQFGPGFSTSSSFELEAGFLAFPTATSPGGGGGDDDDGDGGESGGSGGSGGGGGGSSSPPPAAFGGGGGGSGGGDEIGSDEESEEEPVSQDRETGAGDASDQTAFVGDTIDEGDFIDGAARVIEPVIPSFLKPKDPRVELPPSAVTKEPPPAFSRRWKLIRPETLNQFVFEPLPPSVQALAKRVPELERTFAKLDIERLHDLERLRKTEVALPTFEKPDEMPEEVVFAQSANKLVDFNVFLDVDLEGNISGRINTIAGKALNLVVKPGQSPKKITGYLVLREGGFARERESFPADSLLASVVFNQGRFAQETDGPPEIEERFLVAEFDYTDPDGDGVYTADINAPLVRGTYEVITIVEYEDRELGDRELRLTVVVDPEGYVYEEVRGRELRIPDASVSLFVRGDENGTFTLWPAEEFQQRNPQTTDETGEYSFLVPPGTYRLEVRTGGYEPYLGEPFRVIEGRGVHENIELVAERGFFGGIPWLLVIVVVLGVLLIINFYRDIIRERKAR